MNEVREKVKRCKRVLRGIKPPSIDVEDQSSVLPKLEWTKKIKREAMKQAHAHQLALMDVSTEEEDDDDESPLEQSVPPRKVSQCKVHPSNATEWNCW